jgi:hypothetical protein
MEMHNGMKPVIVLGVVWQTSSVKADDPVSMTNTQNLLKTSKSPTKIMHVVECYICNMSKL